MKEEEGVFGVVGREPKHTEHSTVHSIHPYTYMHAWHTTVQASGGGGTGQTDRQTDGRQQNKAYRRCVRVGGRLGELSAGRPVGLDAMLFRLFVCLFVLVCLVVGVVVLLLLVVLLTKVD